MSGGPNLRRVINASGTETVHGASRALPEVVRAVADILPAWVEMAALQRAASAVIAEATGAEAGFVTNCTAGAICVAVAAAIAGDDLARAEALPDPGGRPNAVVLMKGHEVNYGATVSQMIRLPGGAVREIGTATGCAAYHLEAALRGGDVAAAVYVLSHHTVQTGLLPLDAFCRICAAHGVPVIVDAAAEYDWGGMIAAGAEAVLVSAQKAPMGPTAGIIAGRRDFVRACAFQERGVGRPMKAPKEAVAGTIAALRAWMAADHAAARRAEAARLDRAEALLRAMPALRVERVPDPTGNPFSRLALHLDPAVAGLSAHRMGEALAAGDPKIVLRTLHTDRGYLLMDVRRINDAELDEIVAKVAAILAEEPRRPGARDAGTTKGDLALERLRAAVG